MLIKHRITWDSQYCYTEIEYNSEDEDVVSLEHVASFALEAELAWREARAVAFGQDTVNGAGKVAGRAPTHDAEPQQADGDQPVTEEFYCPEHAGQRIKPSLPQYNTIDYTKEGVAVWGKYYCTVKGSDGKGHNVWRSKAVPASERAF